MISEVLYDTILRECRTKEQVLNLMLAAIDEMQAYNGRSVTACVMLAIGAERVETSEKTQYRYDPKNFRAVEPPVL